MRVRFTIQDEHVTMTDIPFIPRVKELVFLPTLNVGHYVKSVS